MAGGICWGALPAHMNAHLGGMWTSMCSISWSDGWVHQMWKGKLAQQLNPELRLEPDGWAAGEHLLIRIDSLG